MTDAVERAARAMHIAEVGYWDDRWKDVPINLKVRQPTWEELTQRFRDEYLLQAAATLARPDCFECAAKAMHAAMSKYERGEIQGMEPPCYFKELKMGWTAWDDLRPEPRESYIRQAKAALAALASPAADVIDADRVQEAMTYGEGFWRSCSGCHETIAGYPTGLYSNAFKCYVGCGCSECGGIGAIWDTTDYADMGDWLAKQEESPAAESTVLQPGQDKLLTMSMFANRADLYAERAKVWPPLKKALWNVVTGEQLNDGHYINAYELTDKLYAAMLAAAPTPLVQPASEEPVAWQYQCREIGTEEWSGWRDGRAPFVRGVAYETQERPLYTRPQPAKEVVEALKSAEEALASCCDVADWPADGSTLQDTALAKVRAALASLSREQG